MFEYKLVRLPSEPGLELWENFINSYAIQGWKLVQLEQGTVGSGPGYVILERMKSSEDRYKHIMDSGPPEHAAAARLREALNSPVPPKSKSNPRV